MGVARYAPMCSSVYLPLFYRLLNVLVILYVITAGMVCSVRSVCSIFYLFLVVLVILCRLGRSMFVLLSMFITCCSMCSSHAAQCVHHVLLNVFITCCSMCSPSVLLNVLAVLYVARYVPCVAR